MAIMTKHFFLQNGFAISFKHRVLIDNLLKSGDNMKSDTIFFVNKPGLLTTFQDAGRPEYQRFGVPVSGGMGQFAMQVANILVGNPRGLACMEVTFIGPELEVCADQPVLMAITGANLNPKVNGDIIPMWQSFYIEKGDTLTFRKHLSGVRAYIAISGGYDVPYIFGSQSTDMRSGFGKQLEKSTFVKGFLTDDPVLKEVGLEKSSVPIYREHVS